MYVQIENPKENKSLAVANSVAQKKGNVKQDFGFVDNRPDAIAQRKLKEIVRDSPQIKQAVQLKLDAPISVSQRMIFTAARVGLAADIDTNNLAVSEQQLRQLMDSYNIAELKHIQKKLKDNGVKSGLLKSNTNDERLLTVVNGLLRNGPSVPEKSPMGFFEKRTANQANEGQPDVNEAWRADINVWVVGDPQRGIVWGAIANHLRGLIDIGGYRVFGVQCYLLLNDMQRGVIDALSEPDLTMAYVQLAHNAFGDACQNLNAGLGHIPDFNGTSYRQASLADGTVYNGKISQGDVIMDKAYWSTSILRGAGGAAGSWTDIGTVDNPIAYYVIQGTTGKYIAKYAQTEGEREVLFQNRVTFRVTRIVNLKNRTFFVYVSEIAPPPPLAGIPIKDPYTGKVYA